jgi:polysaccharide biosynthesis/export protein
VHLGAWWSVVRPCVERRWARALCLSCGALVSSGVLVSCGVLVSSGILRAQSPGQETPPPSSASNLPEQRIGANDLIALSVYGSPEFNRTIRVNQDGAIRLPMLKTPLEARGKLPAELEQSIAASLVAEQILIDPVVTVTMVEYHSRPISVAGAVKRPTTFQAVGGVSLLDALARAEGLSEAAGAEILVTRHQAGPDGESLALVQRIPVKGLIDAADAELNLSLHGGEEIRVPEAGRVFIVGNVRKPGAFLIQDTTETTVLKMLALSEGLAPFAGKQAYIYRREGASGGKNEIPLELNRILERKAPDVPLLANDVLYIPDNRTRRMAMTAIDRILGFGASTASGVLIYGAGR